MKRRGGLVTLLFAPIVAVSVVLPSVVSAAMLVASSPPLTPLTHSLPAARSGQQYSWTLRAEGGTGKYECVPQSLHIGTLALTAACAIIGTAPDVKSQSVTGPFFFKMRDQSSPPKTVEFGPMNFTTLASANNSTASSFNGTYKISQTITTVIKCPNAGAGAPGPKTTTTPSQFKVVNGMYGGHLISNISALGSGSVTVKTAVQGIAFTQHLIFSHGISDAAQVSVGGIDTGSGVVAGCNVSEHGSLRGSRVSK